jgi:hypothetical protein
VDAYADTHSASDTDCLANADATSNIDTDIHLNNHIHCNPYRYTQTFLNGNLYQNSCADIDGFANEDSCSLTHSLS